MLLADARCDGILSAQSVVLRADFVYAVEFEHISDSDVFQSRYGKDVGEGEEEGATDQGGDHVVTRLFPEKSKGLRSGGDSICC